MNDDEYGGDWSKLDTEPLAKEALQLATLKQLRAKLEARTDSSFHKLPKKVGLAGMMLLYSDASRFREHFMPLDDFLEVRTNEMLFVCI